MSEIQGFASEVANIFEILDFLLFNIYQRIFCLCLFRKFQANDFKSVEKHHRGIIKQLNILAVT